MDTRGCHCTLTRKGTVFTVRVRVRENIPAGYPCHTLITLPECMHDESIASVASILPKFQMLRRIKLTLPPTKWRVHEEFCTAFMKCLQLPSMIEVSIFGAVDFPLAVLVKCTNIKKLSLSGTFNCDVSSLEPSLPYSQFESLSIHRPSFLLSITFLAKTCSPHSLDLRLPYSDDIVKLPPLLQVCSNTLTSLKLKFHGECMSPIIIILELFMTNFLRRINI